MSTNSHIKSSIETIEKQVEIDIDSVLTISEEYITKNFQNDILVFFYNMPNWVVFSKNEFNVFKTLNNYTIEKILKFFSEELVINVLRKLFSRKILSQTSKIKKDNPNTNSKKLPIHIYLTNKCNLRCVHCYMMAGEPLENELTFEDWKYILAEYIEYGGDRLSISGGEPLLVDFFLDLIKWCKSQKSSLYIKLLTNGILLDKLSIDFLNDYIDEIQISIDGPTAEINDIVRGKGHFDKVMNNLKNLKNFKNNIVISMSVLDSLVEPFAANFEQFYHKVISIVPNVKFGIATDLIDGRNYKRLNYTKVKKNLEKISNIFNDTVKKFNMDAEEEKRFERNVKTISCGYGGTITVTANGYIYPCGVIYQKPLGFFKEKSISEFAKELEKIIKMFRVNNLPTCQKCVLKYICGGTCRIENHKINKDYTIPICTEEAKEDMFYALYKDDLDFEKSIISK